MAAIGDERSILEFIGGDVPPSRFRKALCRAAENGRTAILQLLLDYGVSPNIIGSKYGSKYKISYAPLRFASENGHEACVRLLLDYGAEPAPRRQLRVDSLDLAIQGDYSAIACLLIDAGLEKSPKYAPEMIHDCMIGAISLGRTSIVKHYLEKKEIDPKKRHDLVSYHFHKPLRTEDLPMVRLLMQYGATHYQIDIRPLLRAIILEDGPEITHLASVTPKDQLYCGSSHYWPLKWAILSGDLPLVKKLYEPIAKNSALSLLHAGVKSKSVQIMQFLCDPDINFSIDKNKWGSNPPIPSIMAEAACLPSPAILGLLLGRFPDCPQKTLNHALSDAAFENRLKSMELLLSAGAEVEPLDKDRGYIHPLKNAVAENRLDVIKFLLQNGANARRISTFQLTRLADNGYSEILSLLRDHGAEMPKKTPDDYFLM